MKIRRQSEAFLVFVLDQLSGLSGLHSKRMFGAYGLYQEHTFFAIVDKGRLYLKTNEATQGRYTACGMGPLRVSETQVLKHYFEVPVEVLEDAQALTHWAQEAIVVGQSAPAPRRKTPKPRTPS